MAREFIITFAKSRKNNLSQAKGIMARNIFKGLGPALVTPFTKDGEVDYVRLREIVDMQIAEGVDFLCILCTTSETPCLTPEEKEKMKATILDVNHGRVPVMAGCGSNNTRALVEELRLLDTRGLDGLLSVTPFYNKPSQEGLYAHFAAVDKASPLPVVLYNVPGRTSVNMEASTTVRISHDCQNVVAIKEASGKIDQISEIIDNSRDGFDVLSGDDSLTLEMVKQGAVGAISVVANALPRQLSELLGLAREGNFDKAQEIDSRLAKLYRLLFVDGSPAGLKSMMSEMGLLENVLRLPLVPARRETSAQIASVVRSL